MVGRWRWGGLKPVSALVRASSSGVCGCAQVVWGERLGAPRRVKKAKKAPDDSASRDLVRAGQDRACHTWMLPRATLKGYLGQGWVRNALFRLDPFRGGSRSTTRAISLVLPGCGALLAPGPFRLLLVSPTPRAARRWGRKARSAWCLKGPCHCLLTAPRIAVQCSAPYICNVPRPTVTPHPTSVDAVKTLVSLPVWTLHTA